MKSQIALTAVGLVGGAAAAGSEPLLPLPPMGFNNWARFMTNITEGIFVDAAEALVKTGLRDVGYNRLNLDDAWSTMARAANGSMVWDTKKFPKGLPWLTSYMKSKGFIPGIYTDAGTLSCGGYPGALDHEEIDWKDFKAWGFEYLKMDGCNLPDGGEPVYREVYARWGKLIAEDPEAMVFSDSAPAYFEGQKNLTDWYTIMGWAQKMGHLARHSADIQTYPKGKSWPSMMYNYDQHVRLARYQKVGFFNDPDFLNVDHPSYTLDEKKSHFALWCSFSAPLLLSTDLTAITKEEVEYLSNKDLIAINQDKLIQQATLVSRDSNWDVLSKDVENGDRIVTILNKGASAGSLTVSWERAGLSTKALRRGKDVTVKDLWTGKTTKVDAKSGGITASNVPSHGTAVFRIAKSVSPVTPTGLIFNTLSMKCLTDDKSGKVSFKACDGSDGQTWQVRRDGHINSILRPDECIVDAEGKILSRHSGCSTDGWSYAVSGNLINGNSANCLTEAADGTATATKCGYELNEQVVALPIGVTVNEK
ncbi:Alpha-galactosidase [Purpureocillium takamizusanense]|uniref:Alpha-galactosidase n=1 Tax=Purpureocillium takamizusanense TaxID=2060973 RepID=A0A9Q8QEU5_9HYPO|nr:Alpha-galactosidase [Purpureocillium takamizusanense]UNI19524.1 Alpha-galactosidase [Purpureocillium takamizusanense]